MADINAILTDPRVWISALALLVSCAAALISWRSLRNSSRAIALAERQEERRQPQLGIYLANGFRWLVGERQVFGFLVSVTNPTDINNSVARAELQITYLVECGSTAICRINHNPGLAEETGKALSSVVLSLPLRIDAHQTASGWLLFSLQNDLIRNGTIDAHRIILEDTHGVSTITDPIMVREWTDENQKD